MNVVIVEDNENVRESVKAYLELEGYEVTEYADLPDLEELLRVDAACLVLDIMLPGGDGLRLGKMYRQRSNAPLLFLTARVSESDRITGLELGADDYVVKPFSPRELVLRVNALVRRWQESRSPGGTAGPAASGSGSKGTGEGGEGRGRRYTLNSHSLELNPETHRLQADGAEVRLTAAEWNVLEHISGRPGQLFSRMQLLQHCLDSMAEGSERTVDTHVKNLRQKLGFPGWIETERGFGYRFAGREES